MQKIRHVCILLTWILIIILAESCEQIYEQEKYQRPSWLAGKIYTQISTQENLSVFASCLQRTGYDTVLDLTGSYTVFAPNNAAFEAWFGENPQFGNSVDNIPMYALLRIVKSHIIEDGWTRQQVQSLDIYGWIDRESSVNNLPRGYKRQSILREPNRKYWIDPNSKLEQIVDSTRSNQFKIVYTNARKYTPLFFRELLDISGITPSDYEFYYERPFEGSNIYYANCKLIGSEMFAENGFVYEVDQVALPAFNVEQILEQEHTDAGYKLFLQEIYRFPEFRMNVDATDNQPGAREGGEYDTLFNLTYPQLVFDIHQELTGPAENYTVRDQNGLLAPTDEAFQRFIDEVVTDKGGLPHWPNFKNVPMEVKRVIVNAHMANTPIYLTDITNGFRNGAGDIVRVNQSDIVYKYYGSNSTFLGLNEAVNPRAFTSITGPVYLRPGYSTFLYALEYSRTMPAFKREDAEYAFYVIPDNILEQDSSLMLNWTDIDQNKYNFKAFNRSSLKMTGMGRGVLSKRLLNQVTEFFPRGIANREFIKNLAGNYIVVDNENNLVTGGRPNTFGYLGDSIIEFQPVLLEEPTDNGFTYMVEGWFNFPTVDMYSRLISYTRFFNLINKAGLFDNVFYRFPFLTEGELYTVFVPSDAALNASGADTLPQQDLQQFIKYHFIKGSLIFTDGQNPSGDYETLRIDESSTEFITRFSTISVQSGTDVINILDDQGQLYCSIPQDDLSTNLMTATDTDEDSSSPHDYVISGIIHETDSVMLKSPPAR